MTFAAEQRMCVLLINPSAKLYVVEYCGLGIQMFLLLFPFGLFLCPTGKLLKLINS